MANGRIIYVDEDPDDITHFEEFSFGHFSLETVQVVNGDDVDDLVSDILNSPPDAVITDFQLNEKAKVAFTGQHLIEKLQERNKHLPCFLLTSHTPDALEATHDARLVQAKSAIHDKEDLKTLFRSQIYKVIKDHKEKILASETELGELLSVPPSDLTASQRERIISLDNYLEEHGLAGHSIPSELKDMRSLQMLSKLVEQVDILLAKVDKK